MTITIEPTLEELRTLRRSAELLESEAVTSALTLLQGLTQLASVDVDELRRLGLFTNDADAVRFLVGLELHLETLQQVDAARSSWWKATQR